MVKAGAFALCLALILLLLAPAALGAPCDGVDASNCGSSFPASIVSLALIVVAVAAFGFKAVAGLTWVTMIRPMLVIFGPAIAAAFFGKLLAGEGAATAAFVAVLVVSLGVYFRRQQEEAGGRQLS